MNERIKELWSQAGGHYNSGNQHTWPEYTIDDPKKFAELIVRKCAMIVEGFEITQEVALDEYVNYEASTVLKEHFGVEE
jgi:hypothetical protein